MKTIRSEYLLVGTGRAMENGLVDANILNKLLSMRAKLIQITWSHMSPVIVEEKKNKKKVVILIN
jgi:hypothetical protein